HHAPPSTSKSAAQPPSKPTAPTSTTSAQPTRRRSVLHPSVAVLLGVNTHWHIPLLVCRGLSTLPAAWWGLRCLLTFVGEVMVEGGDEGAWSVERRFRVTEVFLALLWCGASAYLSFFFTDCLMSRWLVHYTPQATLVRLLTINSINAYITSWVLYLSGGSEDPRQLLPAWISIASHGRPAHPTTPLAREHHARPAYIPVDGKGVGGGEEGCEEVGVGACGEGVIVPGRGGARYWRSGKGKGGEERVLGIRALRVLGVRLWDDISEILVFWGHIGRWLLDSFEGGGLVSGTFGKGGGDMHNNGAFRVMFSKVIGKF
ncbi:hypothetical protein V502_06474, partial [Pseudogymnoascus sp. VKM F-4520 (FW-2644)]